MCVLNRYGEAVGPHLMKCMGFLLYSTRLQPKEDVKEMSWRRNTLLRIQNKGILGHVFTMFFEFRRHFYASLNKQENPKPKMVVPMADWSRHIYTFYALVELHEELIHDLYDLGLVQLLQFHFQHAQHPQAMVYPVIKKLIFLLLKSFVCQHFDARRWAASTWLLTYTEHAPQFAALLMELKDHKHNKCSSTSAERCLHTQLFYTRISVLDAFGVLDCLASCEQTLASK
jgi:hypothetical protein